MILGAALVALLLIVAAAMAVQFDLSALPEPGRRETALATHAKRLLLGRAARRNSTPEPTISAASVVEGKTRYGVECATCHGMDGRGLTDYGRWMYPRAADLTSEQVQAYNDAELFWVIKNGIRLSGMPAFGKVESDERIWHIVHYIRSMRPVPIR
jgi:mono/diheme cytochrome c family protein